MACHGMIPKNKPLFCLAVFLIVQLPICSCYRATNLMLLPVQCVHIVVEVLSNDTKNCLVQPGNPPQLVAQCFSSVECASSCLSLPCHIIMISYSPAMDPGDLPPSISNRSKDTLFHWEILKTSSFSFWKMEINTDYHFLQGRSRLVFVLKRHSNIVQYNMYALGGFRIKHLL